MKVTIERDALVKLFGRISRVVERNSTIPLLTHIKVRAEGGQLLATGTNHDIEVVGGIPASVDTEGEATVAAHLINDIVRKMPEGAQVTLDDSKTGTEMLVRCGRSRFNLSTLSPRDFPSIGESVFEHAFEVPGKVLKFLFEKTVSAISSEAARYYLNGVLLHTTAPEDGSARLLRAVSTDGHRLARVQVAAPEGSERIPSVIVPKKTVVEALKLIDDQEAAIRIEVSNVKIRITFPGIVLTSKLIEGQFPDYERVIPKANDLRMVASVSALKNAIDLVSTVASERGRQVRMNFGRDLLTLSVSNPDAGTANEEIEVSFPHEAVEIGFNSRYAMEILALIEGERVVVALNTQSSPAIIIEENSDACLFVLMPMR